MQKLAKTFELYIKELPGLDASAPASVLLEFIPSSLWFVLLSAHFVAVVEINIRYIPKFLYVVEHILYQF